MRISESVEWTAHCLTVLAALPEGAALSAKALAEFHGVPGPYLAKALQSLSRADLVVSSQGRRGGYRLARAAEEITLLDVVEAVEGREPAFRCAEIRRNLPHPSPQECLKRACGIAAAMYAAERAWRDSLAAVTVAELAAGVVASVPAETLTANAAWLGERAGRA